MQNKHKKICIVTISLGKGGAERSCAMLSRMLSQQGHDVHITLLTDEIDYPYMGTVFNLGLFKKKQDDLLSRFKRLKMLRKYLKQHNFDAIIDHRTKNEYRREMFYDRYVYRGFKRIFVVHSSHQELYLTEKPEKFKKVYNKNVFNVGVSKYITEKILKERGIQNCYTIYNSYDPDWNENDLAVPSELKNKKYMLFYGRIEDDVKDLTFLIHSFTASKAWEQDFNLVIMGEGNDKEELQALAKSQNSASHILFLPYTKNPFPYIANASFVVLTSKFEGFPMVLAEALSLGVPVVSLDIVSGPSEIIKHEENGLLVSKRSIPLFAEAINRMCVDRELNLRCRSNAKASVRQFSMKEISNQWNQILQDELR